MGRAWSLILAMAAMLAVALAAASPPAPAGPGAPPDRFSAARALQDIRAIGRAPHPTGSAESGRVRAYLADRLRGMELQVETVPVPFSTRGRERLARWGSSEARTAAPVDIVAVLPGRSHEAPAVLLMAHYDTVPGSPGAADDGAGVAAALEIARAIRAGGVAERDLVLLLTDAEELNSDGASGFFTAHPLARRVGVAVNLETRGGGGRALMFETGTDNGALMALFGRTVRRPSANSLAVLIYRLMPNASDFSVARDHGAAGLNFAFLGRPWLYHAPQAVPAAVDPGSVQHLGGQALDIVRALVRAPALPPRAPDAVFCDILGLFLAVYPAWVGWIPAAAALVLFAFAAWRVRGRIGLSRRELAQGLGVGLVLIGASAALLNGLNRLSGAGPGADYYDRLAATPRLELQAALACAAVAVALAGSDRTPRSRWGRWFGLAALVTAVAAAVQLVAPPAGPVVAWPLLVTAVAAAVAAADPTFDRPWTQVVLVLGAALAGGQVLALAHLAFLGVGPGLPGAMAAFSLLAVFPLWPLLQGFGSRRLRIGLAAGLLIAAAATAAWVRYDAPAPTVPTYIGTVD